MVKRVGFGKAACPVARALDVIGDWWSLLIIRDAFEGVRRFSEFQAGLGIAKGMLATRLRDAHRRVAALDAPDDQKARVARRLIALTDASKSSAIRSKAS